MKTLAKLLYVEADEEITDLVDRLRDLPSEDAVTFVVPERARSLQSPMSFRLLKRYADSYGKHVNVISGEPRLQALSLEAGFSAFPNLAAYDVGAEVHRPGTADEEPAAPGAQASSPVPAATAILAREAAVVSAPPKRKSPLPATLLAREKPPLNRRPYYIAAAVVAFLGVIAAVLYLPTASVVMAVEGSALTTDVSLKGAPGTQAGSTDSFPTQALNASESQDVQDTATLQKQIAALPASGQVVFSLSGCPLCSLTIPKGVIVTTSDGKRYATQKSIDISAGFTGSGSSTVQVVADASSTGGSRGNTDAHTINNVENQHPKELTVDNSSALNNGVDSRTATVIQQSDIDSAVKAAGDVLAPKVTQDISTKANGLHLVPVTDAPTSSYKSANKIGDEVQNFTLTVTYTQAAVAFDDHLVRQKILNALKLKLRPGYALTSNPDTSYTVSNAAADGTITVTSHPKGYQARELSIPGLRAYIKGRTPSSASARLYGLQDVKVDKVVIHQSPFGLPWLPFFTSRIDVQIQEVTGTAGS